MQQPSHLMSRTVVIALGLSAVVAVVASILTVNFVAGPPSSGNLAGVGPAYERVMRSNTLRVGYVAYPPATIVEGGGDEISGVFPELIRDIGNRTELDVEFVEEVGWATLIEGLETNRYDIIGGLWANPTRGKKSTVSVPVYYSAIGVWVRNGDTRFTPDNNWASINRPSVRIAAIDGSTPLSIATTQFPNADLTTYPNLTSESQLFVDLASNKIDVFFAEPAQGLLYLEANPGSIENLAADQPLRIFANVFLMRRGEFQLKNLIDTAIWDLQSSGRVEELLRQYEPVRGAFYRIAQPYSALGDPD